MTKGILGRWVLELFLGFRGCRGFGSCGGEGPGPKVWDFGGPTQRVRLRVFRGFVTWLWGWGVEFGDLCIAGLGFGA